MTPKSFSRGGGGRFQTACCEYKMAISVAGSVEKRIVKTGHAGYIKADLNNRLFF